MAPNDTSTTSANPIQASTTATQAETAAIHDNSAAIQDNNNARKQNGFVIELTSDQLKKYSDATRSSTMFSGILSNSISTAGDFFKKLSQEVGLSSRELEKSNALTTATTNKISLLSIALLGAKEQFENSFTNIGLNTFSNQIETITNTILNQKTTAAEAVDAIKSTFGDIIPKDMKEKISSMIPSHAFAAIKTFMKDFAIAADNGLRFEQTIVSLAARTGELGEVNKKAGAGLQGMSSVLNTHTAIINSALGLLPDQKVIENYYTEFGRIPGALKQTVTSTGAMKGETSEFVKTMLLAKGTGQDFKEVVGDLGNAYRTLNVTGDPALQFISRMSEISHNYGIELDDIRNTLNKTGDSFKMFGVKAEGGARMTESAAQMMNNYVGALKNTGISGQAASEIVGDLISSTSNLTEAQQAFISAQTGGPGGLMGAFQIEKMLKEGNIEGVFEKIKQTMQKQFGKVMTVEEASMSPQAAAQFEKQILLLTQGPIKMAKSREEAMRMLEAFKAKDTGVDITKTLGKGKDSLTENVNLGNERFKESTTLFGQGAAKTLQAANISYAAARELAITAFGNRKLSTQNMQTTDVRYEDKRAMEIRGRKSETMSAEATKGGFTDLGTSARELVLDVEELAPKVLENLKNSFSQIKASLRSGGVSKAEKTKDEILKYLHSRIESAEKTAPKGDARSSYIRGLKEQEDNITKEYNDLIKNYQRGSLPIKSRTVGPLYSNEVSTEATDASKKKSISSAIRSVRENVSPATPVAAAVRGTTTTPSTPTLTPTLASTTSTTKPTMYPPLNLDINVYCSECYKKVQEVHQNPQVKATTVATSE